MERGRCFPNRCTYNVIFRGILKSSEFDEAISALMVDRGFSPDPSTLELLHSLLERNEHDPTLLNIYDEEMCSGYLEVKDTICICHICCVCPLSPPPPSPLAVSAPLVRVGPHYCWYCPATPLFVPFGSLSVCLVWDKLLQGVFCGFGPVLMALCGCSVP
ncbi:hypothetical protein BUALT_Bualt14G0069500 [Buddleja alternifolia]|uniref:Pentatricopeptide repeat-containing protein n=1 Tax=Buddleja alternifolia TaxID=168488 RepID=A0AAV6WSM5_9LAMI|nr:hypothetical protein BUALT_Bualt14G0069500 [Buddleja alternifolia]